MTVVPFVKASACGNDFLIIDGVHAPADIAAFTRNICDRHNGVGADGVEWIFPAADAGNFTESHGVDVATLAVIRLVCAAS